MSESVSPCAIPGCDKPKATRGWCVKHYTRWYKHGDPTKTLRPELGMSAEDRFWMYAERSEACWQWTGVIDDKGYGRHHPGRKLVKAHRYAYELLVGPIPDSLVIDHLCRNRACVNPDHLEPVSPAENTRRGNSVKAACPKGHAYDADNTLITKKGDRACRECNRLNSARWRARRRGDLA